LAWLGSSVLSFVCALPCLDCNQSCSICSSLYHRKYYGYLFNWVSCWTNETTENDDESYSDNSLTHLRGCNGVNYGGSICVEEPTVGASGSDHTILCYCLVLSQLHSLCKTTRKDFVLQLCLLSVTMHATCLFIHKHTYKVFWTINLPWYSASPSILKKMNWQIFVPGHNVKG